MRPIDQPQTAPTPAAVRLGWPSLVAWTVLLVLLVSAVWTAATYNQLTRAQQAVDAQWAQVESVYQRRADLVPNLVSVTQGYLTHERALFEALAQARQLYLTAPPGTPQRVDAATELQRGLVRLLGIVERYPDLRSQAVVLGLMDELAGTENRIAVERRRYNERTREYNQLVLTLPRSVIAGRFGFKPRPYFQAEADAATAPILR